MSERGNRPAEEDFDADDSRRSFLKKMGIFAAGVTTGAVGVKALEGFAEHSDKEELARLMEGKTLTAPVPKGLGIDYFYPRSGWNEGNESVSLYGYRKAVEELNSNIDTSKLQEGQVITVPVRNGETLSQQE